MHVHSACWLRGARVLSRLLVLLPLLLPCSCSSAVRPVAHSPWQTDVVVVLTWCREPLEWLSTVLPLQLVTLDVWAKCLPCSDLDASVLGNATGLAAVLRCRPAFNALGREGHTLASFFSQHYDALPFAMLFLQGDALIWEHHPAALQDAETGIKAMSEAQLKKWARGLARGGSFATPAQCQCRVLVEDFFRPCPPQPFNLSTIPRCYGDQYFPVRWFLETVVSMDMQELERVHTLRWAEAAQFAVSRRAVRARPRSVYLTALALLNGTEEVRPPLAYSCHELGGKQFTVLEWAHIFERLWLAILDVPPRRLRAAAHQDAEMETDEPLLAIGEERRRRHV